MNNFSVRHPKNNFSKRFIPQQDTCGLNKLVHKKNSNIRKIVPHARPAGGTNLGRGRSGTYIRGACFSALPTGDSGERFDD